MHDGTDELPYKAHLVPDQKWNQLLEAFDWLIENRCHTSSQRDEACNHVRTLMVQLTRMAWQCEACGRMFIEDSARDLHCYPPGPPGTSRELFRECVF